MTDKTLTQQELLEIFDYIDGHLYWKSNRGSNRLKGKKAGWLNEGRHYDVMYKNKTHKMHRIIFLMHHGYLPKEIDHIDGNPLNNKINNLREVTHSQNMQNSRLRKDNISGEKGVIWDKTKNRWRVNCVLDKKQYHGGYHKNLTDAIDSVRKLRAKLHMEFARYK
jgi:hypothetical protein